jgi:hypothetical protein
MLLIEREAAGQSLTENSGSREIFVDMPAGDKNKSFGDALKALCCQYGEVVSMEEDKRRAESGCETQDIPGLRVTFLNGLEADEARLKLDRTLLGTTLLHVHKTDLRQSREVVLIATQLKVLVGGAMYRNDRNKGNKVEFANFSMTDWFAYAAASNVTRYCLQSKIIPSSNIPLFYAEMYQIIEIQLQSQGLKPWNTVSGTEFFQVEGGSGSGIGEQKHKCPVPGFAYQFDSIQGPAGPAWVFCQPEAGDGKLPTPTLSQNRSVPPNPNPW